MLQGRLQWQEARRRRCAVVLLSISPQQDPVSFASLPSRQCLAGCKLAGMGCLQPGLLALQGVGCLRQVCWNCRVWAACDRSAGTAGCGLLATGLLELQGEGCLRQVCWNCKVWAACGHGCWHRKVWAAGTARCGLLAARAAGTGKVWAATIIDKHVVGWWATPTACSKARLQSQARCLTLALILVQASRKRKSESLTEHSAEESVPVALVTEGTAAQEGLERPLKATKVGRDSTLLCCTCSTVQCNGVERVMQLLRRGSPMLSVTVMLNERASSEVRQQAPSSAYAVKQCCCKKDVRLEARQCCTQLRLLSSCEAQRVSSLPQRLLCNDISYSSPQECPALCCVRRGLHGNCCDGLHRQAPGLLQNQWCGRCSAAFAGCCVSQRTDKLPVHCSCPWQGRAPVGRLAATSGRPRSFTAAAFCCRLTPRLHQAQLPQHSPAPPALHLWQL